MKEKTIERIQEMPDGDLREIVAEVEAMLADRKAERESREEERRAEEAARKEALESAAKEHVREWVQYEWTRCGNPRHQPCVRGAKPHGPYWYHYFTKGGTYTSRYVGKHLDAPAARVLEAHEAKHQAKMALMRGDYLVEIEADGLKGLTPEEVYPERFEDEHREKVLARAAKKREAEAAA